MQSLTFKLSANNKLNPTQQHTEWVKLIGELEKHKMAFGGGNGEYGFEGSISGTDEGITKLAITKFLRQYAKDNDYGLMIEADLDKEYNDFFNRGVIQSYSIPEVLYKDIVGEKLQAIFDRPVGEPMTDEIAGLGLHQAFYGVTIGGTMTVASVIAYLKKLNQYAEDGTIEYGCFCKPFMIPLAMISPTPRVILMFCTYSKHTLEELKAISTNDFTMEGELPKEQYGMPFDWRNGMNIQPGMISDFNPVTWQANCPECGKLVNVSFESLSIHLSKVTEE